MPVVAKILGFANGAHCPVEGQYLKSFDFEANNGQGKAEFTENIKDAKLFSNTGEFFIFYKSIPKCRPVRIDGKPNRPMTACHWDISFVEKQNDTI